MVQSASLPSFQSWSSSAEVSSTSVDSSDFSAVALVCCHCEAARQTLQENTHTGHPEPRIQLDIRTHPHSRTHTATHPQTLKSAHAASCTFFQFFLQNSQSLKSFFCLPLLKCLHPVGCHTFARRFLRSACQVHLHQPPAQEKRDWLVTRASMTVSR